MQAIVTPVLSIRQVSLVLAAVAYSLGLNGMREQEDLAFVPRSAGSLRPVEVTVEELDHLRKEGLAVTIPHHQPAANITPAEESSDASSARKVGGAASLVGYWTSFKRAVSEAASKSSRRTAVALAVTGIVIVGGVVYYAVNRSNSGQASPQQVPTSSEVQREGDAGEPSGPYGPDEPPSDDGSDDESPPPLQKRIRIPKGMMEDIIRKNGQAIWQKFQQVLTTEKMGKVWRDPHGDFRIDAGSVVGSQPHYKTWILQVNQDPNSPAAKRLLRSLGSSGTHSKLYWGQWNVQNPPKYEEWVRGILNNFA